MKSKSLSDTHNRSNDIQNIHLREVEGWTHHVADLRKNGKVSTVHSERPIGVASRLRAIAQFPGWLRKPKTTAPVPERVLTPRTPYLAAPVSYMEAAGFGWSLSGSADSLFWVNFGPGDSRQPFVEFWFLNVVPNTDVTVTFHVKAAAAGPGTKGFFELRSSDAYARLVEVTGFREISVDVIVRPSMQYGVLVRLSPAKDLSYLGFHRIEYTTWPQ